MPGSVVIYRIDARDEICYVNPGYDEFAKANDALHLMSHFVLHRPLWAFISDPTTALLFRDIVQRVRGGRTVRFPFRCDAPHRRRMLEMQVSNVGNGEIEFHVRRLHEEDRPIPALLDPQTGRSSEHVRACSWCKKILVGAVWHEVEEAVARLRLFERVPLPQVTHGICKPCEERVLQAMEE